MTLLGRPKAGTSRAEVLDDEERPEALSSGVAATTWSTVRLVSLPPLPASDEPHRRRNVPCRADSAVAWAGTHGGPGGEATTSHMFVSSAGRRVISRPGGAGAGQKHPCRPVEAEAVIELRDGARAVGAR
jgi:hypothetical protein